MKLLKALQKVDNSSFVIVHIISSVALMNNNVLRSFASQFAQGIIYVMNSLGTEDALLIISMDYPGSVIGNHR